MTPNAISEKITEIQTDLDDLELVINVQTKATYLAAHPLSESNPNAALRGWLQYAAEMGIET